MASIIMTQMKVATIEPQMAAWVIQFHLMTSMAKCKLTKITTERVQRSPMLVTSTVVPHYAMRGVKKTAMLCHKVSAIANQNTFLL